jgi:hypothetical protein
MATLGISPPTEQTQAALAAIAGIRFIEGSEAPGLIRSVGFDDGLSGFALGW